MNQFPGGKGCLENLACPRCGNNTRLFISAMLLLDVTEDGSDIADDQDHTWEDDNFARCPDCGHAATVADFAAETPEEEEEDHD